MNNSLFDLMGSVWETLPEKDKQLFSNGSEEFPGIWDLWEKELRPLNGRTLRLKNNFSMIASSPFIYFPVYAVDLQPTDLITAGLVGVQGNTQKLDKMVLANAVSQEILEGESLGVRSQKVIVSKHVVSNSLPAESNTSFDTGKVYLLRKNDTKFVEFNSNSGW